MPTTRNCRSIPHVESDGNRGPIETAEQTRVYGDKNSIGLGSEIKFETGIGSHHLSEIEYRILV